MKQIVIVVLLCFLSTSYSLCERILIFGGHRGWIGQKLVNIFEHLNHEVICANARLENTQDVATEIDSVKPTLIVNAAGLIGNPNVDWCESHKQETIRVNVLGTVALTDIAFVRNIHVTNISTGCIYEYDEQHPVNSNKGFTEEEKPNFKVSFYSRTKVLMEQLLLQYPNVLNLRVKMPLSTDLEKGFVAKIIKYKKINSIPNSLCVLDDLLPVAADMTLKRIKGNFNFVNPGAISHNEVLELYKQIVDPSHTWQNFTPQELDSLHANRRANAELSVKKLLQLYPEIPDIKTSLIAVLKNIKQEKIT